MRLMHDILGEGWTIMTLRAGFAEIDITPSLPCDKIGWLTRVTAETVRDPLLARVAVFDDDQTRIGFVSLDLLSVRWTEVDRMRRAAAELGFQPRHLMIAATHTHCGPATSHTGEVPRDDAYLDQCLLPRVAEGLRRACEALAPARVGFSRGLEDRVSFIRRFILDDGSVQCHPRDRSRIRCAESVLDPELAVMVVNDLADRCLGMIVNFACHPTHFGGSPMICADWPGHMAAHLKQRMGPSCVGLLLNGAFGDVHHTNTLNPGHNGDPLWIGETLADHAARLAAQAPMTDHLTLSGRSVTLRLPWRDIDGRYGRDMARRQRFRDDELYDALIERLRRKQANRDHFPAELQCLYLGPDHAFVGIPAEPFAQLGLRIKAASPVPGTHVVGAANGMVGYLPTRRAFDGGGYECTLITSSCLHEDAGDRVVDAAVQLATGCRPAA